MKTTVRVSLSPEQTSVNQNPPKEACNPSTELSGKRQQPTQEDSAASRKMADIDLNALLAEAAFERTYASSKAAKAGKRYGRWEKDEHKRFLRAIRLHGKDWKKVEAEVSTRTGSQIRSHAQKYYLGLKQKKKLENKEAASPKLASIEITETASNRFKSEQSNKNTGEERERAHTGEDRKRTHTGSDADLTQVSAINGNANNNIRRFIGNSTDNNKKTTVTSTITPAECGTPQLSTQEHKSYSLQVFENQLIVLSGRLSGIYKFSLGTGRLNAEIEFLKGQLIQLELALNQALSSQPHLDSESSLIIKGMKSRISYCLYCLETIRLQSQQFLASVGLGIYAIPCKYFIEQSQALFGVPFSGLQNQGAIHTLSDIVRPSVVKNDSTEGDNFQSFRLVNENKSHDAEVLRELCKKKIE